MDCTLSRTHFCQPIVIAVQLWKWIFMFPNLALMSCCFYSKWDAVDHLSVGCHHGSRGAIFNPSLPVIGPDGCKAALLQNMSRAGEEEVGVESGKGQRRKILPYTSSCRDISVMQMEHWNQLSSSHQRKEQILSEMYLSFLKGGRRAFGLRTCCWGIWCDLISLNERHHPSLSETLGRN